MGNYANAIEIGKKGYAIDSTNMNILGYLAGNYMLLGEYKESLKYTKKWLFESSKISVTTTGYYGRVGYIYWKYGLKEEAEEYFDKYIEYCKKQEWYYGSAASYAFMGEKAKALEDLRIYSKRQLNNLYMVTWIKNDPLFDSIRDEPEFQQIVKVVETQIPGRTWKGSGNGWRRMICFN